MMRRNRRKNQAVRAKVWLILFLLFCMLIWLDVSVQPLVITMAENQGHVIATKAINQAVSEILAGQSVEYGEMVKIQYDEQGKVTSLAADMLGINRTKAELTLAIQEKISQDDERVIKIPVGSVVGGNLFTGRGPQLRIKLRLANHVETDIESLFESAGINQTHHQIMLSIKTNAYVLIPGHTTATQVETRFCLAETVIVGVSPDAFTQVTRGDAENGLANDLHNYNAQEYLNK